MKPEEIKDLIIKSLNRDDSTAALPGRLETAGVSYSFRPGFRDKVLERLYAAAGSVSREIDFLRSWNLAFYRIALTGVAAIVILLISIYVTEGSFSLNSLLGLTNGSDESIVTLMTGN